MALQRGRQFGAPAEAGREAASGAGRDDAAGRGALRRFEARVADAYAAYLRTRFARVVARPLIVLGFGLLVWVKGTQLAHYLGSDGARDGQFYAVALYYALALAFLIVTVALFALRRPAQRPVRRLLGWAVALAGTFLPSWLVFDPAQSASAALAPLASLCLIGGTAFAIWSLLWLGRCVSIMPEVRGLVTGGPYRLVRHPLYLGEMIATLGVLLPILSARNVAIFAAFCALQVWRSVYEEEMLASSFPDEYDAYRRRTARLIPKVF